VARCFCSVSGRRQRSIDVPSPSIVGVRRPRIEGVSRLRGFSTGGLAALCVLALLSGCATQREYMEPVSIQTVEYYPFQVKGYENTYPKRRILIVTPVDARDFKDVAGINHDPYQDHPSIGVVLDQTGKIDQHIYGTDLNTLFRDAIAKAANEAGMVSSTSSQALPDALKARGNDYVLAAKLSRCWVVKHRGSDNPAGPTWFTSADVAIQVAIYKPPFAIPFWQDESSANYSDPPTAAAGLPPEDQTEIYDEPGQVLSVAMTRAVAGIFKRDSLHELIVEDSMVKN
jgi:hypothetical protein